jgi:hypothetical protein
MPTKEQQANMNTPFALSHNNGNGNDLDAFRSDFIIFEYRLSMECKNNKKRHMTDKTFMVSVKNTPTSHFITTNGISQVFHNTDNAKDNVYDSLFITYTNFLDEVFDWQTDIMGKRKRAHFDYVAASVIVRMDDKVLYKYKNEDITYDMNDSPLKFSTPCCDDACVEHLFDFPWKHIKHCLTIMSRYDTPPPLPTDEYDTDMDCRKVHKTDDDTDDDDFTGSETD